MARWRPLLWPLLAVAPALWLMIPLLGGQMPVSHDHPVHLFKAWQYWEHLLSEGRLAGWSHLWFFGYPVGELYPPGADLWVALVRAVSGAGLSWPQTYGLAFAAAFVLVAWAHYRLGAALFGPAVGVGAAWLAALDLGARREGGWIYTVEYGVWGQPLAMAFTFLGWAQLERLLETRQRRHAAASAVWLALALLTHPTTLILLAFGLPIFLLARAWGQRRPPLSGLGPAAAVTGTALALSGFWLLPFLARRDLTLHIGTTWMSLAELGASLLGGQLFQAQWPAWTVLGFAALAFALVRRRWQPAFLGVFALTLVVFGTTDVSAALGRLNETFSRIQFQRMTIPAKALWHLLVAWAVVALAGAAVDRWRAAAGVPERAQRIASGAALATLTVAVLAMLGTDLVTAHRRSRALPLDGAVAWWADFEAFCGWSRERGEESPGFFRVAYWLPPDDHHLVAAPVCNGLPAYKVGYTPAKLFGRITDSGHPALLEQLSVRYLVTASDEALGPKSIPLAARFGSLWVYELPSWRAARHRLTGYGAVEELTFGSERIALRLEDVTPGARLILHVADHPRWEARADGEVLPIERVASAEPGGEPILVSLPARDGTIELRWRARPVDRAGSALSAAGLLALGGLALRRARPAGVPEARSAPPPAPEAGGPG